MSAAYRIHGLSVRSEIELTADAVELSDAPDIDIRLGTSADVNEAPAPGRLVAQEVTPPYSLYVTEQGPALTMRYCLTCDLVVASDGSRIDVTPDPSTDVAMAGVILTGGGIAFAATRRGCHMLHASGVALGDQAVIVLGHPGSGKTTTATELHLAGWEVLADDAVRVQLADEEAVVFSGARTLRLRDRAVTEFADHLAALGELPTSADGRTLLHPSTPPPAPIRLAAVLVSEPGREAGIRLEPLSQRDALIEAVRHVRNAGTTDGSILASHFSFSADFAQQIPFYRLHRPPRAVDPAELDSAVRRTVLPT